MNESINEEGEFASFDQYADKLMFSYDANAKLVTLTDEIWRKLGNTDSWETKTWDEVKERADEYGKDWETVAEGMRNGDELPAPIVVKWKNGTYRLIGGNTRLMVARVLGIRPKIALFTVKFNSPY